MTFRDWADTEAAAPLELPINGNTYRIPPLGHLDEIRIRDEQARIGNGEASTFTNEDFLAVVLGDVLARMRADNVPDKAIVHAASVAHADALYGRDTAESLWEHGPDPEALAAAMAAYASSTTSPSTAGAASSTKRPANTRSTKSPTKPRSRGTTSSRSRG